MTKKLSVSTGPLLILAAILVLSSCRPAQQARRSNDQAARRAASGSLQTDSILLVQQRMLILIDTMADVMEKDRERIRQLEIEIARLRSVLDRYGIQIPRDPVGSATPSAQPRRSSITSPPPSPPVPNQQLPTVSVKVSQLPPPSADASSRYQTALQAFNEGRYNESIEILTDLKRSDQQSSFAPNYEYWCGESFYALGQYEQAIQSFNTVLTQYPGSSKSDDSEFKIGESYDRLGDGARARISYERLLALYPETEYRPRAEAKLRRLR